LEGKGAVGLRSFELRSLGHVMINPIKI